MITVKMSVFSFHYIFINFYCRVSVVKNVNRFPLVALATVWGVCHVISIAMATVTYVYGGQSSWKR